MRETYQPFEMVQPEEGKIVDSRDNDLIKILQNLFKECVMIHRHWGNGCNRAEADEVVKAAKDAIFKATGKEVEE